MALDFLNDKFLINMFDAAKRGEGWATKRLAAISARVWRCDEIDVINYLLRLPGGLKLAPTIPSPTAVKRRALDAGLTPGVVTAEAAAGRGIMVRRVEFSDGGAASVAFRDGDPVCVVDGIVKVETQNRGDKP